MLTETEVIERVASRAQFKTPVKGGPAPHRISIERYGQHASYVRNRVRVWGFTDAKGRDRFAHDYDNHAVVTYANASRRS